MADDGTRDGKGKARATERQDEKASTQPEKHGQAVETSDLGSRIVDSARGLFQNAMAPSYDAASTLKSALGEKGGSSSSGSAVHGIERSRHVAAGDFADIGDVLKASGPFRESASGGLSDDEFQKFMSTDNLEFNQDIANASSAGLDPAWTASTKETEALGTSNTLLGPAHIQETDGADVVALLADPSFNVDMDTSFPDHVQAPEQTVEDLFPHVRSRYQDSGTTERPQPPIHKPMPANHPLALKPRSDEENRAIEENIHNILDGTFAEQHLSASQTDDVWLADWLGVLDSYTDEVWGDMLPMVRETRAQLDEVKSGTATIDRKAVARLKMIIGHLQLNR